MSGLKLQEIIKPIMPGMNSISNAVKNTANQAGTAAKNAQTPGSGGGASPALQAQVQDHEGRIRRLEGMVAHQASVIAALQQGQSSQATQHSQNYEPEARSRGNSW